MESQMGAIAMESFLSDYKPVGGIVMAHRNVTKLMGQERIVTVQSIEHNVDLPADRFALPPEIKALIKKNE